MRNRTRASFVSIVLLFSAGLLVSLFQNCGGGQQNIDEASGPPQGIPTIIVSRTSNGPAIDPNIPLPYNAVIYTRVFDVTPEDFVVATGGEDCPVIKNNYKIKNSPQMKLIAPGVYESEYDLGAGAAITVGRVCAARSNALNWEVEEFLTVQPRPGGSTTSTMTFSFTPTGPEITTAGFDSTVYTNITNATKQDYLVAGPSTTPCSAYTVKADYLINQPEVEIVGTGIRKPANLATFVPYNGLTAIRVCFAKAGTTTWSIDKVLKIQGAYFAMNSDGTNPIEQITHTSAQTFYSIVLNGYGPGMYLCQHAAAPPYNAAADKCANSIPNPPANDPTAADANGWILFNGISASKFSHCTVAATNSSRVSCTNSTANYGNLEWYGYVYNSAIGLKTKSKLFKHIVPPAP